MRNVRPLYGKIERITENEDDSGAEEREGPTLRCIVVRNHNVRYSVHNCQNRNEDLDMLLRNSLDPRTRSSLYIGVQLWIGLCVDRSRAKQKRDEQDAIVESETRAFIVR